MEKIYLVQLRDGSTGTISSESINGLDLKDFIGETVRIQSTDENGNFIEIDGILEDIADEN